MSLLEFQRRMAADVMRPLTPDDTMREQLDDGADMSDQAGAYVKPNRLLSAFERLDIYNRQYWFRVLDSLRQDFPALEAVVGEERFETVARDYLAEHPSRSFTLRNLGSRLPAWLATHREYAEERAELAIDVARLEWAYVEAFDLAECAPIGAEEIAQLDDTAEIGLQPHLQLLELRYPVDELVLSVHKQRVRAEVASQASTGAADSDAHSLPSIRLAAIARRDTWMAVHRYNLVVHYKRIAREEYRLLTSLAAGRSLGEALEAAFFDAPVAMEEQVALVNGWFGNWAELGWLCSPQATAAERQERIP